MKQKMSSKKARKYEIPDLFVQFDESARAIAEGRIKRVQ